jgi:hypothetical protein
MKALNVLHNTTGNSFKLPNTRRVFCFFHVRGVENVTRLPLRLKDHICFEKKVVHSTLTLHLSFCHFFDFLTFSCLRCLMHSNNVYDTTLATIIWHRTRFWYFFRKILEFLTNYVIFKWLCTEIMIEFRKQSEHFLPCALNGWTICCRYTILLNFQ